MNKKKIKLIEAGMKLFAEKGYHMTSIEEIASEAGVSKGAFYLHFESKKDFIMTSLNYYHQEIAARIENVQKQNLAPRDSLAKQIGVVIRYIYKYKDFLTMQLRQNISIGQSTDTFIQQMKLQNFHWLRQNIENIYGEQMACYYPDIIIQLEGLMNGYVKWIIIDGIEIDRNHLGAYLVRRMDDLVSGMLKHEEAPLVTKNHIPDLYQGEVQVSELLFSMKAKINSLKLPEEKAGQLHDIIMMILNETGKEHPQKPIIQGLLVHFQRMPEFEEECKEMGRLLHIDLLD
ncbi:transcriptional regulator, TetR family [Lentibacillus halodurans]|uniref:Transcriptional regulator, TetR family n=1 Tax=Lentibacillus halodurans TaxID=237679 RepID=A0A1I0ZMN4_9BACI|nr:TetR/AcrR family transcriptional regulator [Lentibacillus halodurans]SFB26954.1 transcriptional regulator, TetR family [Lentibacillus halodurans]